MPYSNVKLNTTFEHLISNGFFYCIYIVDACKEIDSKADKMRYVASKWQSLSDSERVMWQNEAKKVQRIKPSMLTEEDRKKQIAKGKKN